MIELRLGSLPIRIEWSFLLTALLLSGLDFDIMRLLSWLFIVFVSVIIHELGHAAVARLLGGRPEIVLRGLGGVTYPRVPRLLGPLERVGLSLAGPFAGLMVGVAAFGLLWYGHPWLAAEVRDAPLSLFQQVSRAADTPMGRLFALFVITSVTWTALNLLPIFPLDGGNTLEAVVAGVRGKPSVGPVAWFSAALSLALGVVLFVLTRQTQPFLLVFFGVLAVTNFNTARAARGLVPQPTAAEAIDPRDRALAQQALREAHALLSRGEVPTAIELATRLELTGGRMSQAAGLRIRAAIALQRGDHATAAIDAGRSFTLAPDSETAVLAARAALREGDRERAGNWLKRALEAGAPLAAVQADAELGALAV